MTHHILKTDPQMFDAVKGGTKNFEVRNDDRAFQAGDIVHLERFDRTIPGQSLAPPEAIKKEITFVLRGGQYGIEPGYVVFGLGDVLEPDATADEMRSTLIEIIGIARDRMDDEFTSRTGVLAEIADIAVKVAKPIARPTLSEKEAFGPIGPLVPRSNADAAAHSSDPPNWKEMYDALAEIERLTAIGIKGGLYYEVNRIVRKALRRS